MSDEYGHFSEDGREYVITRRDLPFPWLNYLTNGDYLALTSFQGGGLSSYLEQRFNSLTRRYLDMPQSDLPGRFVYVRDQETREVWSATAHPVGKCDSFSSAIGLGYTRVETEYSGIAQEMVYFVPKNIDSDLQGDQDPCEIWRLRLTNRSERPRTLRLYSYSEWVMGDVLQDMKDAPFYKLFRRARYEDGVIYGRNDRWGAPGFERVPWPNEVFLTSTRAPAAWELSTLGFVGMSRTLANPLAPETDLLGCQTSFEGDNVCGGLAWEIELAPGETKSLDVILGVVPDGSSRFEDLPAKYRSTEAVDRAFEETRGWWERFTSTLEVSTPDIDLDRSVNYWNKYQVYMTCSFGHGPSYFHGNQHATMRDSMQDAFGLMPLDTARARRTISRAMSFQYADGSPSYASNRMNLPERKWDKVDLPLWLSLTLDNYLAETGDWRILDEAVPFYDEGEGSLYEHLRRGLERVSTDSGERGLPLIGKGDWNDALDLVGAKGRGESVWLGQFLAYAFKLAAKIATRKGHEADAESWLGRAAELDRSINACAWDGDWYVRAFDDRGEVVGGKSCTAGRIYLNTQTWAVLSETAPPERARRCMESAFEHLMSDAGMALFHPAYPAFDANIGIISQFPVGKKENAACFTHAGAFALVAMLKVGLGDEAYRAYRAMMPAAKPQPHYRMEPYCYSQYCAGPDSPDFGQGAFHWMTGSASWMLRAVADWMLGLRPQYDGLLVDPCIPKEWAGYTVTRSFRGSTLHVEVRNPAGVNKGVAELKVDGKVCDPLEPVWPEEGREVRVEVEMG